MQQHPELADSWWSPLQNPKPDYSEIGLESVSWVGSCIIAAAIIQEPWTHDADSDPISDHETSPINQIESPLSSKWSIYINEALNKSRSKLSYICCQRKHSGKINDTWTTQMVILKSEPFRTELSPLKLQLIWANTNKASEDARPRLRPNQIEW